MPNNSAGEECHSWYLVWSFLTQMARKGMFPVSSRFLVSGGHFSRGTVSMDHTPVESPASMDQNLSIKGVLIEGESFSSCVWHSLNAVLIHSAMKLDARTFSLRCWTILMVSRMMPATSRTGPLKLKRAVNVELLQAL